MDVRVGDILEMKKPHPCGEKRFLVRRIGMDFKIECCKRPSNPAAALQAEKNIKKLFGKSIRRICHI